MKMKEKRILLKGTPASPGEVRGKVKIIIEPEDTGKIEYKDILVTPFTNPLFIPAILKALAIITDEGGMMCHAAIVSREFGIPCVTGTGQATKKLADEMEVIVDGERGLIYG